jgi:hypothetical protein
MRLLSQAAWVWALSLCGCSLLVDPDSLAIKCDVPAGRTMADPCLSVGLHCVASECKPCKATTEICNGIDDDCDGVIDNGQDEDGDGFTWCGGGIAALADCAPTDPAIHPGRPDGPDGPAIAAPEEVCDGKDNDCDGQVDDALACMTSQTCAMTGCPTGQICDAMMGVCIVPRPVGSGCMTDTDCAGGFCVKPKDFGLTVEITDNRCATACCNDADCDEGSVCVVNSAGSRLCLPANIAARPATTPSRCTADADCGGGICDANKCKPRCFSDKDCGDGTCVLNSATTEQRLWMCRDAPGRLDAGAICFPPPLIGPTLTPQCKSGFCSDAGACTKPCGHDKDCDTDEACRYGLQRQLLPTESLITSCEPRASTQSTDTLCCTNADCGKGMCAPKSVDPSFWAMVCH